MRPNSHPRAKAHARPPERGCETALAVARARNGDATPPVAFPATRDGVVA